jgi:lipoprotein-anchoring transpeptidase ErfK/SrfK
MNQKDELSRREFLRIAAIALGGTLMGGRRAGRVLAMGMKSAANQSIEPPFAEGKLLGRICAGYPGARFDIKSEPYWDAPAVGTAWFDDVFEWKREVIAKILDPIRINQRWVETPEGFIYAEYVQKTKYLPQPVLSELPLTPQGDRGMWVEIVTPYFDLQLTEPKSSYQYWVRETILPRIYYSQVFWAFDMRQNPETGKPQYCLRQLYGAFDDSYWVDADICRQITPDEVSPIHPEADNKRIIVDLDYQTISCYEGSDEVFFAKVTTGGIGEEGKWLTPIGVHTIWRKTISVHMSAGAAVGNYDIPGIGWSTFFDNNGAAIHSTFWHNYFGTARSHGCVNAQPEDAKWIWRWVEPAVSYYPGDWMANDGKKSTLVEVIKS